jgi:hypothetical protein
VKEIGELKREWDRNLWTCRGDLSASLVSTIVRPSL